MTMKAQPIKVRTADLIKKVQEARAKAASERDGKMKFAHDARLEKAKEAQEQADRWLGMTDEEFIKEDYHFSNLRDAGGFDKILTMLSIASDEFITISQDSDLARYI